MEAESYSKLHLLVQWAESPLLYPDTNFGPLHTLLLWLPWKIFGSLVFANRVAAVLFSIGLFFPLYSLVKRTQGTREALVAAALLFAAALPVAVGVVTLSEGPYLFFFIAALAAFARLIDKGSAADAKSVVAFAALMSCALALRFESWMFLPLWPVILWRRKGWKPAVGTGALLAVFPLAHMAVSWDRAGHPLRFLLQSRQVTALNEAAVPLSERALGWFDTLVQVMGWPMFAVGIVGVAYALIARREKLVAGLFLWHLAVVEAQAMRAALAPELHRYAALLVVLMIPPAAQLISDAASRIFRRRRLAEAACVAAGLALSLSTLPYLVEVKRATDLDSGAYRVAVELKNRMSENDRVFLGSEAHPLIVVESGGRWSDFRLPEYPDGVRADAKSIETIFHDWRPTMALVNQNDPSFAEVLGIEKCAETRLFGAAFAPVFSEEPWCLLERKAGGQ